MKKFLILVLAMLIQEYTPLHAETPEDIPAERFSTELTGTKQMFIEGVTHLRKPDLYPVQHTYAGGKTALVNRKSGSYDFCLCTLVNVESKRIFFGFVDYSAGEDNPVIAYGTLLDMAETDPSKQRHDVRFDLELDLVTKRPRQPLTGTYNFGAGYAGPIGVLEWKCGHRLNEVDPNYHKHNSADGKVAYTPSGFACADLFLLEHLTFNANGTGKASQVGTAEGREDILDVTARRGPRGGKRANHVSSGAVEYSLTLTRSQPMTFTLDKESGLLTLRYSPSTTHSEKYHYATDHPVMTEIKNSYARWATAAPKRFVGSEQLTYVNTLPSWLVVKKVGAPDSPASYIFVPKAGLKTTIVDSDSGYEHETDRVPARLVDNAIEYYMSQSR